MQRIEHAAAEAERARQPHRPVPEHEPSSRLLGEFDVRVMQDVGGGGHEKLSLVNITKLSFSF